MKLVMITCRFEYNVSVERILREHGVQDYIRVPMAEGGDKDGRHDGSKVHPGQMAVVWVQLADDALGSLLEDLRAFKEAKAAHEHLTALALTVSERI